MVQHEFDHLEGKLMIAFRDEVPNTPRVPRQRIAGWCSWYSLYATIDEAATYDGQMIPNGVVSTFVSVALHALVILIAVGLVAMAIWQAFEAAIGAGMPVHGHRDRVRGEHEPGAGRRGGGGDVARDRASMITVVGAIRIP